MNVTILGVVVAYSPDYTPTSKLWKVHLRDAFRMVTLADTECFVKRFASKPRAWDFMVASKGKRQTGLPIVYDAKLAREDGKIVYYLFLEKIEGDTLHDFMKSDTRAKASAILMARALAAAFHAIHSQGYWHADFCAKNIMVATTGRRFVLIDLDSLEPVSARPTPTPNEPGYIPDQELAVYALTYVREYVSSAIKSFAAIPGPVLNLLQLVFLLDKLVYFVTVLKPKGVKFRELAAFRELPHIVHQYLGAYTDQLAKRILDRVADSEMIVTQPGFLQKELPVGKQVAATATPRPRSSPKILFFRASRESVLPGQTTQLTWHVEGATSIEITGLGPRPAEGSYLIAHSSALLGEQIYTLIADGGAAKRTIMVDFFVLPVASITKPPVASPSPTVSISSFRASSYSVSAGEQTVISWKVIGVTSVFITNIGTVPAAGAKLFDADAFSGQVEFVLTAGNPAIKNSFFIAFSPVAATISAPKSVVNTPQAGGLPAALPPKLPAASVKLAVQLSTPPVPAIVPPLQSVPPKPYTSARPALQSSQAAKSKSGVWKLVLLVCALIAGFWAWAASRGPVFSPNQLKGLQQFDRGLYDSSFINLAPFRDDTSHHFAVQYNLAYMYDNGKGAKVNNTLAVELYNQCLRSTTPGVVSKSLYALGYCSLLGEGCLRDVDKAKGYFALAANRYHNVKALSQLKRLNQARLTSVQALATHKLPKLAAPAESSLPVRVIAFEPTVETVTVATSNVVIKRIVQLEDYTRVDFIYTGYLKQGHQIYLCPPGAPDAIRIDCGNASYSLLKTSNISDNKNRANTVYPGHPRYFSAYFEKIPADVAKLNIIEGGERGFAFYGVELSTESL
jgi:TPR repeat protein